MWNEGLVLCCNTSRHACTYCWEGNIESISTCLCCKTFVHEWKQLKQESSWSVSGQKGRCSKKMHRSRATIAHCPNSTHSHQSVYIHPSFCDALHCITVVFFRLLLSAVWKPMNHKITRNVLSHREWKRASLEILVLKAIVQHCFP